jgi:hypothetical protein
MLAKSIWKDLPSNGLLKSKSTTEVLSKSKKPTWKPPKEIENSSRFLPRKKEGISKKDNRKTSSSKSFPTIYGKKRPSQKLRMAS